MATPVSVIIDAFFHVIEEDDDFFDYYRLTDAESMQLATERADALLTEALAMWRRRCTVGIPTKIVTEDIDGVSVKVIESDLTTDEIDILANLMFERYLSRDIAKFRKDEINFTPKDLQKFSPSNSRKTFMAMYKDIHNYNTVLLKQYEDRNRDDGSLTVIDYGAYAGDDE